MEDAGDQEDQGDADDEDMKAMGAVDEEPVITIGVDGEKWDESENAEENSASKTELGWSQEVSKASLCDRIWKELERACPKQVQPNHRHG